MMDETPNLRQNIEEFDKAMRGATPDEDSEEPDDTPSSNPNIIFDEEPPGVSNETFYDEKENADEMIGATIIINKDGKKARGNHQGTEEIC